MKRFVIAMIASMSVISVNSYADAQYSTDQSQMQNSAQSQPNDSAKNQQMGKAFLLANQTKPGVKTLADGLQYKVLNQGNGPMPTDSDVVVVDYAGTLINGTEFDSSYKRGQPATFPVSGVIPGWTEALKLMPVGSTWELYIPASLAYGDQGAPPSIGPNETLIFKVHLISMQNH